ncbi:MAG TPA: hypothetical protein VIY08_11265 [Candidatus Nitrosocosmicus sp.]
MLKDFIEKYNKKLISLCNTNKLSEEKYIHFKKREFQFFDTSKDLNCPNLSKILPYVVIGASKEFVDMMKIPYQSTSFVAGEVYSLNSGIYAYKIIGKKGGGVQLLSGGNRKVGDNLFASLHRILIGSSAIMVTINNMMENSDQIWSWDFFGKNLLNDYPLVYKELFQLSERLVDIHNNFFFVISIRSFESINNLKFIEMYNDKKIAMLNPKNSIKVIIITTNSIYNYISKYIRESSFVFYITTGENFDIQIGMEILRKKYGIKYLLNDGGRIMTNSISDCGILSEERVTLEIFNRITLDYNIDNTCILGKRGDGIDNSEIKHSILLDSQNIGEEKLNVYIYPMDEKKIF